MSAPTYTEIRDTIANALGDRAKLLREDAGSRRMSGPAYAEMRGLIRAEAKRCEDLQRIIGHADPGKLASALGQGGLPVTAETMPEPEFSPGDKAIWTGSAGLFERPVTISEVRYSYLAIFGETPDDARIVYDIHDADVVKGVILGIPAGQLKAP